MDGTKKRIPFSDIQSYLEEHESLIQSFIMSEKKGRMSRTDLEKKMPQQFMKIQFFMSSIFKKNYINQTSQQIELDKKLLDLVSDQIHKIQKDFEGIQAGEIDVHLILRDMKASLELSLDSNFEIEINRVMENFKSLLLSFENHIQKHNDVLIKTLEEKYDKSIMSLQNELKLKDLQIQEYKVQDSKMVDILSKVVEDYKQRVDYTTENHEQKQTEKVESSDQDLDEEEKKSSDNSEKKEQPVDQQLRNKDVNLLDQDDEDNNNLDNNQDKKINGEDYDHQDIIDVKIDVQQKQDNGEREAMLYVDVDLGSSGIQRIVVFDGDQAEDLAATFAAKFPGILDESMEVNLAILLQQKISEVYIKIIREKSKFI